MLSENQNLRKQDSPFKKAPEKDQQTLKEEFKGIENAKVINNEFEGFSIDIKPQKFNRVTDVIFFSHGIVSSDYKELVHPKITDPEAKYFELPTDTQVFEYYDLDDNCDESLLENKKKNRNYLIQKI